MENETILITPVQVVGTAADVPVFEYPVPGVYDGINVSGDIKVVYEASEENSVRLYGSQEMADRLILNYQNEGLYFSLAPDTNFTGTLYVKGKGLEFVEMSGQSAIQLKGAHPLYQITLSDHAKADLSEATAATEHLHIRISSPEPFTFNGLNVMSFSLLAELSAQVEMHSIRSKESVINVEDNAVVCLSGECETGCMDTRDFARLDASHMQFETCDCVVKRESSMLCNVKKLSLYVFPTAHFQNLNPDGITVPYTDVPTMIKVRLLSSEDVAQITRHLKISDSDHEHLLQIVCEFVKRKQVYYGSITMKRSSDPDTAKTEGDDLSVWPLSDDGDDFYQRFRDCFQNYLSKQLPESFELLCQVEEDDVDWESIPDVKERFLQSPLLDYEETDIEYED